MARAGLGETPACDGVPEELLLSNGVGFDVAGTPLLSTRGVGLRAPASARAMPMAGGSSDRADPRLGDKEEGAKMVC